MADNITHVRDASAADNTGMSAFMIVVLLVALLALGAFVYYAVNGGIPGTNTRQAVPDNSTNIGIQGDLNLPANPTPTNP